jgi:hypothetical protein
MSVASRAMTLILSLSVPGQNMASVTAFFWVTQRSFCTVRPVSLPVFLDGAPSPSGQSPPQVYCQPNIWKWGDRGACVCAYVWFNGGWVDMQQLAYEVWESISTSSVANLTPPSAQLGLIYLKYSPNHCLRRLPDNNYRYSLTTIIPHFKKQNRVV